LQTAVEEEHAFLMTSLARVDVIDKVFEEMLQERNDLREFTLKNVHDVGIALCSRFTFSIANLQHSCFNRTEIV